MPKALLIYNPNAGRFSPVEASQNAAKALESHGWAVEVTGTRDAAHVDELACSAASEGLDVLVVAGGDGSIGRTIKWLRGTETALAVLPTGTANVWAKQLGLPMISPSGNGILENTDLIVRSTRRKVDIGLCNGSPFLLWAGLGFDAMIVQQAEKKRSHFKKLFVVPEYFYRALVAAHNWQGLQCTVDAVDRQGVAVPYQGQAQIAIVSNTALYAGGYATLAPEARLNDGQMELWLFKGRGARRALRHAWNLLRGTHVTNKDVIRIPFVSLEIFLDAPAPIHFDGDPVEASAALRFEIDQDALTILAPPTAPYELFSP